MNNNSKTVKLFLINSKVVMILLGCTNVSVRYAFASAILTEITKKN